MYLRDVQDHSQQALEFVKADQEMLSGMMDLYLSLMSQKTNDKMKVLAGISTIFMPLTLIAGIYGMNFSICQNYDGNRANRWFSCLC